MRGGRLISIVIACSMLLLTPGSANAEGQAEKSSAVMHNSDGGKYYHTTAQCRMIHEKYLSSMCEIPLELVETFFERVKPCYLCFGEDLAWIGQAEVEEAMPHLAEYLRGLYEDNAGWELISWKLSSLKNVLLFHVLVEGEEAVEIMMAKVVGGWVPVGEVIDEGMVFF